MKKKLLGITALTAALTLSTGITAFAAGWVQDSNGWGYQRDNGTWYSGCWFTDPATGLQYYFDPDGYMMTETRVEGFWLDANGVKHEKTEAELEAEAARAQRVASRPSPAKKQAAATEAAKAAKTATSAATTTRLSYQAEMKVFMDNVFIKAIQDDRKLENYTAVGDTVENNLETTYSFSSNGTVFFISSLGLNSNPTSASYTPYAIEFTYNRNVLSMAEEAEIFNSNYKDFVIAALGATEGEAVYNRVMSEELGNGASFDQNGTTDTGNSYELTYRNGAITIKVTCSEIDPSAEQNQEAAQEEEAAPAEETAVTSSVITVGQASAQAEEAEEAAETEADTAEADETEDAQEANAENSGEAAAE